MIQRIVDSVSLLINSESQCKMDMLISSDNSDREVKNNLNETIKSTVLQNNNNMNLCCSSSVAYNNTGSYFTCESSYPIDLKSENSKLILNTCSSSCYVEPKSQSSERPNKSSSDKDETVLSSDSTSIRIRSRSPPITDLSSTTTRLLPGGPSIPHPRNRRVQNTKKKENRKNHGNNRRPCLTITSVNKGKEVLQIDSSSNLDKDGTFSQADPLVMEIECHLLPFYRDLRALELRLPAKFSERPYRHLLKQIASEYELLILSVGKNESDDWLLIRKRGILRQKQEKQLEEEEEKERERQRKKKEKEEAERAALAKEIKLVKDESQTIPKPGIHEMCCQAEFDELGREVGHKRARRIRKNRERQKRQSAKNVPTKRDRSMQTVPEDYWHCLWCNQHIAPENQCGHEAMCRADVQQKQMELELKARLKQRQFDQEMRKRQRLGLPPLKKTISDKINNNHNKDIRRSAHSRSRTRQVLADKSNQNKNLTNSVRHLSATKSDLNEKFDGKLKTFTDKLEQLHPNDIEAMYKLMKNVCNEPKCNLLANSHLDSKSTTHTNSRCSNCKLIYCFKHLPIGKHFKCPIIDSNQISEQLDPNSSSIACGNDLFEKKEALKAALRERKAYLKQLRERN